MKRQVLVVLAVALLMGAEKPKEDAAKKDFAKFEGTWEIVSMEVEGMKLPEEQFKDAPLVLKGDQFTMKHGDIVYKGTFKLDVAKKPKELDITYTEGPEKGKTLLAIYDLQGDTYKVCIDVEGKGRPTEFASKKGSGHVLQVLKREKP